MLDKYLKNNNKLKIITNNIFVQNFFYYLDIKLYSFNR